MRGAALRREMRRRSAAANRRREGDRHSSARILEQGPSSQLSQVWDLAVRRQFCSPDHAASACPSSLIVVRCRPMRDQRKGRHPEVAITLHDAPPDWRLSLLSLARAFEGESLSIGDVSRRHAGEGRRPGRLPCQGYSASSSVLRHHPSSSDIVGCLRRPRFARPFSESTVTGHPT